LKQSDDHENLYRAPRFTGVPLKVDLKLGDDGQRLFHFRPERAEGAEVHPSTHPGLRGWFERKALHVKDIWQHADRGLVLRMRHVWDWLQRRMHPDEPMLVRMRSTPTIEINHPASLSSDEAKAAWAAFLAAQRRRHLPWLVVNGLISPLTVLLAPLPGPNIVGYWFVYRAARDLLALLGVRRAKLERVPTRFQPSETLDPPIPDARPVGGEPAALGPEPILSGSAAPSSSCR
jgi:hypothetical protein